VDEARAESMARELAARVVERVEREGLEFATWSIGLHFEDAALAREGWLGRFRSTVKTLATASLAEALAPRPLDPEKAEATFVYDPRERRLEARLRPIFLYGRYRKLVRGLPQTRWHCRACGGRGCRRCGGKGRQHPGSVEESLGGPVAAAFRAAEVPLLHGMGREDLDVLMLGTGRPFVLEVISPRRRTADLASIVVGEGVELAAPLRVVAAETVERVKSLDPPKRYRARCAAADDVDAARLAALPASFEVQQRTPGRVERSRADLVRARRILSLASRLVAPREVELEVVCEAGTYVKELVSGDQGRTTPSLAELLGVPISVSELDVLEVMARDEDVMARDEDVT
jgi:tRNA pseudouridine synthase 10